MGAHMKYIKRIVQSSTLLVFSFFITILLASSVQAETRQPVVTIKPEDDIKIGLFAFGLLVLLIAINWFDKNPTHDLENNQDVLEKEKAQNLEEKKS